MLYDEEEEQRQRAKTIGELLGESPLSSEIRRLAQRQEAVEAGLSARIDAEDRERAEESKKVVGHG